SPWNEEAPSSGQAQCPEESVNESSLQGDVTKKAGQRKGGITHLLEDEHGTLRRVSKGSLREGRPAQGEALSKSSAAGSAVGYRRPAQPRNPRPGGQNRH